jgi:CheY-like chemotaxis protein
MPVMDGFQATMALRQKEAALSRPAGKLVYTPVIAITATADYKQKCIDAGMDDWMPKPFNKDKLCRLLNLWLGKSDDTPGESDRQDHQSKSKMTTPEEERRRVGHLERNSNKRGQVEVQEEKPEIGEARAKGEAREDEEKAQERQGQGRRRRRRRGGAGATRAAIANPVTCTQHDMGML